MAVPFPYYPYARKLVAILVGSIIIFSISIGVFDICLEFHVKPSSQLYKISFVAF